MNWMHRTRYLNKMAFMINQVVKEAEQADRLYYGVVFPGYPPSALPKFAASSSSSEQEIAIRRKTSFSNSRHSQSKKPHQ